ncbi:sugar-binding protein [Ammoniphilus sp. YIM 78166]|uniref:sugar-binding protein n=1 Tax=Ammoniphilus sp. YIM 78166 TaxID=1644106 RepID=UPI0010703C7E|nr:sugar-binding protein [Ammoniphilus sp. YIM 78166]
MSDKKWKVGLIALSMIVIYLFIGFAINARTIDNVVALLRGAEVSSSQRYHVVLIEQEQRHPYWQLIERGALDAAKIYDLELEYTGPVRNNMEEQIKLLEKAIASKVDGIIVQGLNDEKFTPVINKAIDKGIPVLTIDTDAPTSRRLTYVGTDNFRAGNRLGHMVVQATGGQGKIGVLIGSDKAENQMLRLNGLKHVIDQFPGLEIVAVRPSNISRIEAVEQAIAVLAQHPEIDTMVGTSALDALGMVQAKNHVGRYEIRIIGFDDLPETLDGIRKGEIVSTLAQKPYLMGYDSIRLLHDHFRGRPLPKEHYTEVEVINASHARRE